MLIDFHTHNLYGIDDGAKTLEDSLNLLQLQVEQGVGVVVLTPHFNIRRDNIDSFLIHRKNNFDVLQQAAKKNNIKIDLYLGAEVYFSNDLFNTDLQRLALANTRYILIEFSSKMIPNDLQSQMHQIISSGYIPILAHIERYPFLWEDGGLLIDLIDMGVLTQINASTILNKKHRAVIKTAIKHNLVHFIASDSHSVDKRPPLLGDALREIETKFSKDISNEFIVNAENMIVNHDIEVYEATKFMKIFGRFI